MTRFTFRAGILVLLSSWPLSAAPVESVRFTSDCACDVVVRVTVDDRAAPRVGIAAFRLRIDAVDTPDHLLIFIGSGRRDYAIVAGPVAAGRHEAQLIASPLWPETPVKLVDVSIRSIGSSDADADLVKYAPALWMRADTIGTASDLPLLLFAERQQSKGLDELTYSFVFSNEDGGTSTAALMARWGRTTDIEWVYRARFDHTRLVAEEYQAVDHAVKPFAGRRVGTHPVLVDATLNNNFSDTGETAVRIRLLPRLVDLTAATRESVLDAEPWTYRVMTSELEREGKVTAGAEPDFASPALRTVPDPRSFVYVDARLTLSNTAVAVWARDDTGTFRSSAGGLADLRVARSEWVRIAVPTGGRNVSGIGFECAPVRVQPPQDAGTCVIEVARAFRLDQQLIPGPNLMPVTRFELRPGELRLATVKN